MITLLVLWACDPDYHRIESDDTAQGDTGPVGHDSPAETGDPIDSDPLETVDGVDWPALVVNELMASNASTVQEPSGGWADWIELYNPTETAVDVDGWTISDALTEPDAHTLDALEVPAGGYLLLWADDAPELGPEHLSFSLAEAGEAVGLFAPDGTPIDGLRFGQMAEDVSLARSPDGGQTWALSAAATPGESNGGAR